MACSIKIPSCKHTAHPTDQPQPAVYTHLSWWVPVCQHWFCMTSSLPTRYARPDARSDGQSHRRRNHFVGKPGSSSVSGPKRQFSWLFTKKSISAYTIGQGLWYRRCLLNRYKTDYAPREKLNAILEPSGAMPSTCTIAF